ncbi:bifunctional DNA-formamidopyrimidine glycosylase/DNA-(apurinic or apyrimidinic site) lyase [Gemmatimonadota bacterium]
MPELPEVETVVRQLAPFLLKRVVRSLEIFDPKLDNPLKETVRGRPVRDVTRMGKQIVIGLAPGPGDENPLWLGFHLRMTGRLIMDGRDSGQQQKHLRARLALDRGAVNFYDIRRFGMLKFYHSLDAARPKGINPLSRRFTSTMLEKLISGSRQQIKPWLLRQDRLVGIGNIYASEILFAAGIDPRKEAVNLTGAETRTLHRAIRKTLRLAIKHCGTTFSDFQDARGRTGSFQNLLSVYRREGLACPRCGEPVVRIVQQQRSTFFSPGCQQ